MKTSNLFLWALALTLTTFFSACDDDDNVSDPVGTIALNMLNEDNGMTFLGNSDVYINNAYNFYSSSCLITNLGKRNGLGAISTPVLSGLNYQVAVEPGCAYQVFEDYAVREFPSGNLALKIKADYYNAYVVSTIIKGNEVAGANVKFVLMDASTYDLPEYNTHIGTLDHRYGGNDELTIDLPTADFECDPNFWGTDYYTLEYEQKGKQLTVRLLNYKRTGYYGFYIRIKDSYTYIYGEVV